MWWLCGADSGCYPWPDVSTFDTADTGSNTGAVNGAYAATIIESLPVSIACTYTCSRPSTNTLPNAFADCSSNAGADSTPHVRSNCFSIPQPYT